MGTEEVEKVSNPTSELETKIIRQIEYYFGNYNLARDKFLKDQLKLDDGWVPLETMLLFKRLKSITEDPKVICEALKKSPNELIEIDGECTKIRRRVDKPLPDSSPEAQDERTLYVKGFRKSTTLDELLEYFKQYNAENITMRRHKFQKNKPFKGSCFVMFETKEDAENFLADKEVKYENTELLKETKKDYVKRKDIFFQNLRAEKQKKQAEKTDKDSKEEDKEAENGETKSETKDPSFIPGCLLKMVGLGKDCSREDLIEVFEKHGPIAYVDYSRGQAEAVVRFESGIAATVYAGIPEEDCEKKMEIKTAKVTFSLIEGDSEVEYWKDQAIKKANIRKNFRHKSGKGRFNNQGWGKGKRNNREDDEGDQHPSKKQKLDSSKESKETSNGDTKEVKVTVDQE